MDSRILCKSLIKEMAYPFLREEGFRLHGEVLYSEHQETLSLLGLQRSSRSTADKCVFTLNAGVLVKPIAQFLKGKVDRFPQIDDCHWRTRVGSFLSGRPDRWWEASNAVELAAVWTELQGLVADRVLPALSEYRSVDAFLRLWLSGKTEGTTEFERMVNLAVLLKVAGRTEDLGRVMSQLSEVTPEKPVYLRAQALIERLRA